MIQSNGEEWLDRVLRDCLKDAPDKIIKVTDLEGFRIIVGNLVRGLRKIVDEIWALWELEPDSKQLRDKFHLLEQHLYYLNRFCKGEVKGKYQK